MLFLQDTLPRRLGTEHQNLENCAGRDDYHMHSGNTSRKLVQTLLMVIIGTEKHTDAKAGVSEHRKNRVDGPGERLKHARLILASRETRFEGLSRPQRRHDSQQQYKTYQVSGREYPTRAAVQNHMFPHSLPRRGVRPYLPKQRNPTVFGAVMKSHVVRSVVSRFWSAVLLPAIVRLVPCHVTPPPNSGWSWSKGAVENPESVSHVGRKQQNYVQSVGC